MVVLSVGIGLGGWQWQRAETLTGNDRVTAQNEAVRTGLTAAGGVGAVFALLLAVRRQRSTEAVAEENRFDAAERRVTELQLKAVEQLGSEKAPVRLGALQALDRLGDGNPEHRQTVIDLLCSYLRMPFREPGSMPENPTAEQLADDEERAQERVVRLTAQRLLADRLRAADGSAATAMVNPRHWPGRFDLDLNRANLINFDFVGCVLHQADFSNAVFTGNARFDDAVFAGEAWFTKARFTSNAVFVETAFVGAVTFDKASFDGGSRFDRVLCTVTSCKEAWARTDDGRAHSWPPGWVMGTQGRRAGREGMWTRLHKAEQETGEEAGTPATSVAVRRHGDRRRRD
ncbi:Pentapeptide repeats (9 copies) [Actinoalloteichus hymeniacidonis]|uniref:Pentapeptide repeats (9 copies) n=1 Tax=Actinoalloteichus hymeniacidonis TaxID=340345 RepID=A0AAC9HRZ4_9PSEU|nr:Pentapeptide repeats (9 copies) [Actinoalloteichus hymeniacidonis]